VNKYHNVALPLSLKTKKEIAVVNKLKQSVRLVNFSISNDGVSKVKFRNVRENNQSENGMVIVKAKIHERLRFQMQPEIVSAQNLTIATATNEPKINEEEIINVELEPKIDENKIYEGKPKIKKRKNEFCLSSSVVYDNLVQIFVNKIKKTEKTKNLRKMVKPLGDRDNLSFSKFESLSGYEKNVKTNKENEISIERHKRDLFENTIIEPLGQDIIMIEEFCESYYDINNFADYAIPQ